jgi:hypothetical protein
METSSVYFILAEETNRVKIGFSNEPERRLSDLQTGSPCTLRMLAVFPSNSVGTEKALHAKFAKQRVNGEWFHFHASIREFLTRNKQRASMFSYHVPIRVFTPFSGLSNTKAKVVANLQMLCTDDYVIVPSTGSVLCLYDTASLSRGRHNLTGPIRAFLTFHLNVFRRVFRSVFQVTDKSRPLYRQAPTGRCQRQAIFIM